MPTDAKTQLVSVIAISFRSSSTIIATLESIRRQTYPRIELILCDDCSDDNTLSIARDWLSTNKNRFERSLIIAQPTNSGIVRNYEAGLREIHGEWIKPIACDDILCSDAISKFLTQTQTDDTELVFSQITKFRVEGNKIQTEGNLLNCPTQIDLIKKPKGLLKYIRNENFLPAPGAFYSHKLLKAAGGLDSTFKHLDDWPLWLRILPLVQRVSWIDKPLVLYRISDKSVSQEQPLRPIGAFLYHDRQRLYQELQRTQLSGLEFWHMHLQMLRQRIVFEHLGNSWLAYRLLMPLQALSPLTWRNMSQRIFHALSLARVNAAPLLRGVYYFGLPGFRQRVRVFGPITITIPRSQLNIGHRVVIHSGATLTGKKGASDTISIGSYATLEKNSYINAHGGSIVLGDHVHVGVGCVMQGYGGLIVGDNTMLGPYAQIYTSNHRTSEPPLPRNLLGEKPRAVRIGQNCWIAANCIILPGASIPDESVLPASEVVRRNDEIPDVENSQLKKLRTAATDNVAER